jgi:Smg protein
MKESVLDILIYLFENYFDADLDLAPEPDRDTLKDELERAGFSEREVGRALEWLDQCADPERTGVHCGFDQAPSRSIRVFDAHEQARLDSDCRGYILYLENIGIGSTATAAATFCIWRTSASSTRRSASW